MKFNEYLNEMFEVLMNEENCQFNYSNHNNNLIVYEFTFNCDNGSQVIFKRINSGRYAIYKGSYYENGKLRYAYTLIYASIGLDFGLLECFESSPGIVHGYRESYILNELNNLAAKVSDCYTKAEWYDPDGYDWQNFEHDIKLEQPNVIWSWNNSAEV